MLLNLITRTLNHLSVPTVLAGVMVFGTGCQSWEDDQPKSFLDPSQMGRLKREPLVVPILNNLNIGADEQETQFASARDVSADDLVSSAADYTISANDLLSVSISDLVAPGAISERTIRVTQTGKISLQLLTQPVKVEGLTEQQVEKAIGDAYRDAGILKDAQVSVAVVEARGRTYSVFGANGTAGPFTIYDADFRLLDALVASRELTSGSYVDTIYVIRKKEAATAGEPAKEEPKTTPAVDPLAPRSMADPLPRRSVMLQDGKAPEGGIVVVEGKEMVVNQPTAATQAVEATPLVPAGSFEFQALKEPEDKEVIRIPYQALKSGQLKYNIIIKPNDLIFIPPPLNGEYYVGGNVGSAGAYSLTASKLTLSQAIVAARGLNDVAWPSRTEIIRRLPGDKQVFVKVDLDKIFAGEEPDLYIKPSDRINVGTSIIAPFLASIRNGFRFSYGFGFLYDRNFDDTNDTNN